MELINTQNIMQGLIDKKQCDSYAVYVFYKGERELITSKNVNADTYFDIASCGKVMVTSTLILKAVDQGELSLDDTLDKFFCDVPKDKSQITVRHLLTHTSGIIRCDLPREIADKGNDALARYILNQPLKFKEGTDCVYSCNGFILLGFILEKVYNMRLDQVFNEKLKKPLNMSRARFNLPKNEDNFAVTYARENMGEYAVDDENVYNMRGIAGSGAQFYTINDAVKLMDAIINESDVLFSKQIHTLAQIDYTPKLEQGRGLGYWLFDERFLSEMPLFSKGTVCHFGSTGTAFFVDKKQQLYTVIFTNCRRFIQYFGKCSYEKYKDSFFNILNDILKSMKDDLIK